MLNIFKELKKRKLAKKILMLKKDINKENLLKVLDDDNVYNTLEMLVCKVYNVNVLQTYFIEDTLGRIDIICKKYNL